MNNWRFVVILILILVFGYMFMKIEYYGETFTTADEKTTSIKEWNRRNPNGTFEQFKRDFTDSVVTIVDYSNK